MMKTKLTLETMPMCFTYDEKVTKLNKLLDNRRVLKEHKQSLIFDKQAKYPNGYPPSAITSKIGGLTNRINRLERTIEKTRRSL